ncbi:glycosyltransferase family 4 protein [Niastella sp. OAS944]|uniref:glycosyltransferase family 4 protein n=1 Tax=Niastella sp. OAS944 TaxID=2664089 RepID=UPI0034775712|nr:glycosyltransferase involved in cell wall biosynthesis [Chitinophagaceae bacterium OAS944]
MARFLFYDDKIINLMIENEKPCGGAAVQSYGWIKGLLAEGQEVVIMTDTSTKEKLKEECKNIKLVPFFDRKKGIRWLRWLYYRIPDTYKKIKAVKPDYLYVSIASWSNFLVVLMCRMLNIKFIQRISNDNVINMGYVKNSSAVGRFFLFQGLKLSHHILCQNNYQLHGIKKRFPNKSVIKLSNPLYLKDAALSDDHEPGNYIAWLGVYRMEKGLKRLFEIASLMTQEQFVIAGKEGANYDSETKEYVEKLKQLPNVKFCGYLSRTEVLPYLAKARFLLNTSMYEGFSNTFLESLAVGTPIITASHINPDSIISNHNLGIIYNDVPDLCKQYASLTPEQYQQMSDNAREYVTRNHGYRVLAQRLLRYLSETDNIILGRDGRIKPLVEQTPKEIAT